MRELARMGVDVHVAMPTDGPRVPEYEAAGIKIHPLQTDLPVLRPQRAPALFGQVRELVRSVAPDIIHSHFVGTTLTMRLALGRGHPIPRIFQVPGPIHLEHPFFRRAEHATGGPPDYWIGTCKRTCDIYRGLGVPEERVFLSYYGTDMDRLRQYPKGKLRAELGVGEETLLVGMVAFLYAPKRYLGQTRGLKGHEDLIDALALALPREPRIMGVFIGGPWGRSHAYEQRVHQYARERLGDRAVFLGTRDDVPQLYPDLDVVAHPSHTENVGGAGESLLLAVPTIATDVGGFPDFVIDGQTGWLVPAKSPEPLSAAVLEALRDPDEARARARRGQEMARRLLDVKNTAVEVFQIYERILQTHGASGAR
jgi:glycosyltransferase involved in cell wall biosynthesis